MACVWLSDDSEVRVLPDACADIVFESGRLIVAGPASTQVIVPETPGHARFGVRFRVGSAGAGLGVAASELLDDAVALSDLWGTAGRRLEALVAAASSPEQGLRTLIDGVGDRQQQGREADVVVREAAFLLAGGASFGEACRRVGMGERHLRRRFERAVGYGPGTFIRVQRFQRFLTLADRHQAASLAQLASDAGYADQAHLSRECRRLSGLPPTALLTDGHRAAGDKSVSFKPQPASSASLRVLQGGIL